MPGCAGNIVYRPENEDRSFEHDKKLNKMRRKKHFFSSEKWYDKKVEKYTKMYSREEEFL